MPLTAPDIRRLFSLLNKELAKKEIKGELYLVGGAVLCLVHQLRPSTKDIDAYFLPVSEIRAAAARVALATELREDWLNDAVKGYLSAKGEFAPFLELSHLTILTAQPEYLLAMKCLAMRLGEEFHDLEDVRYLLRYLNIANYQTALDCISKYYPAERFPQKTLYALESIINGEM